MQVDGTVVGWYRFYLFGRFILGVSHEVDNYLSVVLGFSELLKINPSSEDNVIRAAEKIMNSAESLARMMKKYSFYVRPAKDEDMIFRVGETITEIETFARYDLMRNNVAFETRMNSDDLYIRGDRRDFAFMLLNIMINASESMAGKGGLQLIEVDRDDDKIVIRISDEGHGIPKEIGDRIFEPLYTTKDDARIGLGLPVSKYLVDRLGGSIHYLSEVEKGTRFEVCIPVKK